MSNRELRWYKGAPLTSARKYRLDSAAIN